MIIAFYGIAIAMILGGLAALVQGYGIIVMERGWTLVIAGTISAASGALLLGITAALSRLSAIQADLARLRDRFSRMDALPEPGPHLDPIAAVASGGFPLDALGHDRPDRAEEPTAGEGPEATARPGFPFRRREREPAAGRSARESLEDEALLFGIDNAEPKPAPVPGRDRTGRSGPRQGSGPEPDAQPSDGSPPAVVGTYTSGGNRYTMYGDGSIEADTPHGVYRFSSLDELKEFVASGAESGPRSQAL